MNPSPAQVGSYRLGKLLGSGGMGEVYAAVHETLGTKAAVKIAALDLAENPTRRARFLQEARILTSIDHPGIVRIFDCGLLDKSERGRPFIIMEILDGQSLRARMQDGPLAVGEACHIARTIAEALAHAHSLGVVHRDLKPDNVMFVPGTGQPRVKVIDFGIAKSPSEPELPYTAVQTDATALLGTAAYMAPEQCRDAHAATERSDVYSLGVVLFEMLGGRPPFQAPDRVELLAQQLRDAPPDLRELRRDLPTKLCALVEKLLAKDPQQRPTMAEAAALLSALPSNRSRYALRLPRRNRLRQLLIGGALSLVAALVAGLGTAWLRERRDQEQLRTELLDELQEGTAHDRSQVDLPNQRQARIDALRRNQEKFLRLLAKQPSDENLVLGFVDNQHRIGNWSLRYQQPADAERPFLDARQRLSPLMKPGSSMRVRAAWAENCNKLADIFEQSGRLREAEALYREVRTEFSRLLQETPQRLDYQERLASTDHQLGQIRLRLDDLDGAEQSLREAMAHHEAMRQSVDRGATTPNRDHFLAISHYWLGSVAAKRQDAERAVAEYGEALRLQERAQAAAPLVGKHLWHRARIRLALACVRQAAGAQAAAAALLTVAVADARAAVGLDSGNRRFQKTLAECQAATQAVDAAPASP